MTPCDIKTASELKCQLYKTGVVHLLRAAGKYHVPPERAFFEKANTPADAPEWLPRPPQTQATSVFLNKGKSVAPGSLQALVSLSRKIVRS